MNRNSGRYRPYLPSYSSSGWMILLFVLCVIMEQLIAHSVGTGSAVRAAEAMGYSNIKVTGRHTVFPGLQGCGENDMVKFDVSGVGPKGVTRTFFVCDGFFKGATVRFN